MDLTKFKHLPTSVWNNILILIGIAFRVQEYLSARSLWIDEAIVVKKIKDFSLLTLADGSVPSQALAYPLGFLAVEKIFITCFGTHELAVRAFPFICGIVSLILFSRLSNEMFGRPYSVLAMTLFALSPNLIYYSSEAKPYALDVALAVFLLLLFKDNDEGPQNKKEALQWSAAGALAVWFSYSAVFLLAAVFASLLVTQRRRLLKNARFYVSVFLVWGASFLLYYLLILADFVQDAALVGYWEVAYMPAKIMSLRAFKWLSGSFYILFQYYMYMPAIVTLVLFVTGLSYLVIKKKGEGLILLFMFFSVIAASCLKLYPFRGRFILFVFPAAYLAVSAGLAAVPWEASLKKIKWLRTLIIVLLLISPVTTSLRQYVKTSNVQDIKPVLQYVGSHIRKGDALYVHYKSIPAFEYYRSRYRFEKVKLVMGRALKDEEDFAAEAERMSDNHRVWLLMTGIKYRKDGNDYGLLKKYMMKHKELTAKYIVKVPARQPPFYNKIETFSAGVLLFEGI